MWAHQHSTRDNIQQYAENLFREISPELKPNVFLLGILREDIENRHPICIQPEDCGIDVALFNDVNAASDSIWKQDPRQDIFYGMPYIHHNYHDKIKRESVCSAVQQLVDKNFTDKNIVSFVSQSVHLEKYEIFVVLQFDADKYNYFYNLTNPFQGQSLFDSLLWTFLEQSLDTLYRPRAATSPQSITISMKEIMRIAALDFVDSVIYTICQSRRPWQFLNICNYVSSLKYEGDMSVGELIVCGKPKHPNLEIILKLIKPVKLTEYRKIRKLLEIASRDLALYSNGLEILGFGKIKGCYNEKNHDLVTIRFSGSYKWELVHGNNTMLIVEHTNPGLPKLKINKGTFDHLLKRIFSEISILDLENLWKIVDTATTQKHGALLIISDDAKQESLRLINQSTCIEPTMLDESLIRNVTSIDGAVLLDSHGICHSIGVILDGMAVNKGTSARGARYNSAVRYVENNKKKCVAIIVSEDGMVDMYPEILPKIKKSEIKKYLSNLRIESNNDILDGDKYHDVMHWFEQHKFYLSQEQCNEINKIKNICNKKDRKKPFQIFIVHNDLEHNSDMDESYFVDENN